MTQTVVKNITQNVDKGINEGQNLLKKVQNLLNKFLSNTHVCKIVIVLLLLYSVFIVPNLSKKMSNILNSTFVKIVVAVVIILLANTHPVVATVLSIAFVLTLRTANKHNFTTTKSNFVLNNKDNDNKVPDANQESCVKTWNNQHCIQGLEQNNPNGFSSVKQFRGANSDDPTVEGFANRVDDNNECTNCVSGSEQNSCVKTWENQHSIQALEQNNPDR